MSKDFENDMGEVFQNFRLESEKKDLIFDQIAGQVQVARLKNSQKRRRLFMLLAFIGIITISCATFVIAYRLQQNQLLPSGVALQVKNRFEQHPGFNNHPGAGSWPIHQTHDENLVNSNTNKYTNETNTTLIKQSSNQLKDIMGDQQISDSYTVSANTNNPVHIHHTNKSNKFSNLKNTQTTKKTTHYLTHLSRKNRSTNKQSTHQSNQTSQVDEVVENSEKLTQLVLKNQNTPINLTEMQPVRIQDPNLSVALSIKPVNSFVNQESLLFPNVLKVSGTSRNRFSIGARLMPMVSFNHYGFQDTTAILPFSTLAGNSLLLSQRIKDDVPSFSYTVGIFGTYQPISYLRLEVGVNYCSYSTPFSFRDTSTSPSWPFLNENEVYDYEYDLKFGQFTTTANYIGVPVSIVGILPLGRVELGLRVSATPSFITMADSYTYDYNYTYLRHVEYSPTDTIFNRFNFNLGGGIHIAYTWKDVLRFSLTPELSYNITSLYQNHYAISQNTWGIGGNLGIEYLFTRHIKK